MKRVQFLNLAIQGFRSFKRDIVFPFPSGNGFHFLRGENGAGKSSVWGALTWALYGKTDRGLKAGDVGNWDGSDLTTVMVEMRVDGIMHALTRTWNPNSLNLEADYQPPKPVTQEVVDELLGLDYAGFLNSVLVSQFGKTFFDLGAGEKLQVFGEALSLSFWEERGDLARREAKGVSTALQDGKNVLYARRGRLEALREERRSLRQSSADHQEARRVEMVKVEAELAEVSETAESEGVMGDKRRATADRLRGRLDILAGKLSKALGVEREAEIKVAKVEGLVNQCRRDVEGLKRRKAEMLAMRGDCPTCEQKVPNRQVTRVAERIQLQIEWERGERERALGKLDTARDALAFAKERALQLKDEHTVVGEDLKAFTTKATTHHHRALSASARVVALTDTLRRLSEGEDPHTRRLREVREEVVTLKGEVADREGEAEAMERRLAGLEYWAKEFKTLRLWLIEDALAELEVEVNNALVQLGLEKWRVTFEVERETNSGTVSRGFHVFIKAPGSKGRVRWEAWSGGETQRLRVAGAIGLANLIRSRRGVTVSLEVWDEPTTFLNDDGVQDLLTFFQSRAQEDTRQIWLVDHRSHNFGFDSVTTIVKAYRGSEIQTKEIEYNDE